MSFREKSAWITLVSVLICFGSYFAALGAGWFRPSSITALHYALISLIALVLLQIVLYVIVALRNPREARAPRDEREQAFVNRARSIGYYVLMIWMMAIVFVVHIPGFGKVQVVFLGWLGVIAAILVVAVAQIVQFRRGA